MVHTSYLQRSHSESFLPKNPSGSGWGEVMVKGWLSSKKVPPSKRSCNILLGGSSHLVSGLVHPRYKWTNPRQKWDEPPSTWILPTYSYSILFYSSTFITSHYFTIAHDMSQPLFIQRIAHGPWPRTWSSSGDARSSERWTSWAWPAPAPGSPGSGSGPGARGPGRWRNKRWWAMEIVLMMLMTKRRYGEFTNIRCFGSEIYFMGWTKPSDFGQT